MTMMPGALRPILDVSHSILDILSGHLTVVWESVEF